MQSTAVAMLGREWFGPLTFGTLAVRSWRSPKLARQRPPRGRLWGRLRMRVHSMRFQHDHCPSCNRTTLFVEQVPGFESRLDGALYCSGCRLTKEGATQLAAPA